MEMMLPSPTRLVIPLILLPLLGCRAEKDNRYYPWGNPNVNYPLYWSDAPNILDDITQFQSLYITFSGCVYVLSFIDDAFAPNGNGFLRNLCLFLSLFLTDPVFPCCCSFKGGRPMMEKWKRNITKIMMMGMPVEIIGIWGRHAPPIVPMQHLRSMAS